MLACARLVAPLLLSAALAAPLQCARSHPSPEQRTEDDPAEVLYQLAGKFGAQGNQAARVETLRFLMARYPASRFAVAARLDLDAPIDAPGPAGAPR